jgi:selenide,water dikinase
VGVSTSDDAGVFRLRDDLAIVNTVDFFTPIVDDPYTYGAIAAANALSDVYAMGGVPKTALNIVCWPQKELESWVLAEILRGGAEKAAEAGVVVVGGHTVDDPELKFGMAVTGVIDPRRIVRNVGTGILSTALKRGALSDRAYAAAVETMSTLNRAASEAMLQFEVHAATDVTGFGLLGHAFEMAHGSDVTLRIGAALLPLLPEVADHVERGHLTGGCRRNRRYLEGKIELSPSLAAPLVEAAFDPQTSGGLLIAVAERDARALLEALRAAGASVACEIGEVVPREDRWVKLL